MFSMFRITVIAIAAVFLSGCITAQSYVDPAYRQATFDSVLRAQTPTPVKVEVKFLRNGEHFPRA